MSNRLTREQVNGIIALMPETMQTDEIIALICTIIDLYGMQEVWSEVANDIALRLAQAKKKGATIN